MDLDTKLFVSIQRQQLRILECLESGILQSSLGAFSLPPLSYKPKKETEEDLKRKEKEDLFNRNQQRRGSIIRPSHLASSFVLDLRTRCQTFPIFLSINVYVKTIPWLDNNLVVKLIVSLVPIFLKDNFLVER